MIEKKYRTYLSPKVTRLVKFRSVLALPRFWVPDGWPRWSIAKADAPPTVNRRDNIRMLTVQQAFGSLDQIKMTKDGPFAEFGSGKTVMEILALPVL
jgi:hypothetical protein